VAEPSQADIDPSRFITHFASPRGFRQAYVHEGVGGVPLVCVHGWPETKRIYWRVIEPLAAAGFEVIVPDLRGFGESDLGGPVIQDLALRHPDWVERMVLFNSPLAYDKERMGGLRTRPAAEATDYLIRQGTVRERLRCRRLRAPRRAVPAARLRALPALGGAARARQRSGDDGRRSARGARIGPAVKVLISRARGCNLGSTKQLPEVFGRRPVWRRYDLVVTGVSTEGDTPPG
jgi:pimeloyl-ACP methyl ester carboxylesterase